MTEKREPLIDHRAEESDADGLIGSLPQDLGELVSFEKHGEHDQIDDGLALGDELAGLVDVQLERVERHFEHLKELVYVAELLH